ncbi:lipoprotein [Chitinibacter sp. S2-10]|uniref:lipoprotein n=1 Tax=Chitinibacter sp. S2-10 TaxID=3373597 RepID=UPI003977257B
MKKTLFTLFSLLFLAACSSTPPERQDFLIEATRSGASLPARFSELQVNELRSHPPYRDLSMVYRESAQRFVADPYHGFLSTPSSQITQQTRQWLASSGLFSRVYPTGSNLIAPWQLEGELLAMYIDVSMPHAPKTVIKAQYLLSHNGKSASFLLSAEHALPNAKAETAAQGYQETLRMLLIQLEQHLISSNVH